MDEHNEIVIEIIQTLISSKHVRTAWKPTFYKSMSQNLSPTSKVAMLLKTCRGRHHEALTAPPTDKDNIVRVVRKIVNESNG